MIKKTTFLAAMMLLAATGASATPSLPTIVKQDVRKLLVTEVALPIQLTQPDFRMAGFYPGSNYTGNCTWGNYYTWPYCYLDFFRIYTPRA